MRTITLNVPDELALRLEKLTEKERQTSLDTLTVLLNDKRSLFEVMDDISEYARKHGMKEGILNDLLKNDNE